MILTAVIVIAALLLIFIYASIRILREYERGVVFTLGRYTGTKGPGLFLLVPFVQQMVRVDLRVVVDEVPPQDVISRDNVSVKVSAVLYFRVIDPERAIIQVSNYLMATTASSPRPRCAGSWASTISTRCWPSATSSTPTSRTFSTSRPKAGASRSPRSRSSASISTRAWSAPSPVRRRPNARAAPRSSMPRVSSRRRQKLRRGRPHPGASAAGDAAPLPRHAVRHRGGAHFDHRVPVPDRAGASLCGDGAADVTGAVLTAPILLVTSE